MVEERQRLGRYELLAEIGRGAMGVVYRARDPIIDRVLAIKTVDFRGLGESQAEVQARFFQEAQSAGRLNHPNIVTIFDAGEAEGCAYIAMELLEGASLRELLDHEAPLSVRRALEIAGQIARGLAYAHEHGVVHRDVKPANVILVGRRVKITDFGIARLPYGPSHAQSELAGSPKYMSPEQVGGENVDGRSDLFALGIVLYEMLTGTQPFVGDSVSDIMKAVLLHEPPAPSSLNAQVPPAVDAFVRRVLSKRADDRHPSARALLRELAGLLKQLDADAPVRSRSRRTTTPQRAAPGDTTVLLPARPRGRRMFYRSWPRLATAALASALGLSLLYWLMAPEPLSAAGTVEVPRAEANLLTNVLPERGPEPLTVVAPATPAADSEPAPQSSEPERPRVAATAVAAAPAAIPKRSAAEAVKSARLLVAVAPWGEVYVNGVSRGVAPPLADIALEPGRHRVEIRNGKLPVHRVYVQLRAGDTRRIKHKFE